jgi:GDP-mannose 6-dehydrogenase
LAREPGPPAACRTRGFSIGKGDNVKIAVFGLGYVGTVSAACLASEDRRVVGTDPDPVKVSIVDSGRSPVVEPDIDDVVNNARTRGWLSATGSVTEALDGADVALLCVGTPSRLDGSTDLTYIERASAQIGAYLRTADHHLVVVVRSTVPPGTVEGLVKQTVARESGKCAGVDFTVAMCPEFLREGSSVKDFFEPPFTVIGAHDERAVKVLSDLFSFIPADQSVVSIRTAEALKYACNAFHAVKVSFANEIGRLYASLGIDSREVMELFVRDTRLNVSPAYLRPGFAFGGSCLPKDLRSLLHMARTNSVDVPLLAGTLTTNELIIRNLVRELMALGKRNVALLGISFKPQTDDLRESPYVELAEALVGKGFDLKVYDPIVRPDKLFGANLAYVQRHLPHLQRLLVDRPADAIAGADVVLVASPHADVRAALVDVPPELVFDLVGSLGDDVESNPGYRAVSWAVAR